MRSRGSCVTLIGETSRKLVTASLDPYRDDASSGSGFLSSGEFEELSFRGVRKGETEPEVTRKQGNVKDKGQRSISKSER